MKDTKVLFIVPPNLPFSDLVKSGTAGYQSIIQTSPPLGILSIASYIRQFASVDIKIVDLNIVISKMPTISFSDWEQKIFEILSAIAGETSYDIVGISALFNTNFSHLLQISKIVKSLWPDAIIVSGGALASNLYNDIFKYTSDIDAVAITEAEKPFLGLVQANERRDYLEKASGWMTPARARAGMLPATDYIFDLDDIPFLAYDLINLEEYQQVTDWHGKKLSGENIASIITTRGCPNKCTFCANTSMHGRKLRYMSMKRILQDLRVLRDKYGVGIILIEDDMLISDKTYATKLLESLSEFGMRYDLASGLAVDHVDADILDSLKATGIDKITLAVESGSERVLRELMCKAWSDLSLARKAVSMLKEKGFYITATFILGMPGETREDIEKTVRFIKEVGFNWSKFLLASPVAGSELYEICKKNNYLTTDNLEDFHFAKGTIRTPFLEPEELDSMKYNINLEVNFVENYDIKRNRPEIALVSFQDVIRRVPDHAFAHYYISVCHDMMGNSDLAHSSLKKYQECLNMPDSEWLRYARHFGLPLGENIQIREHAD